MALKTTIEPVPFTTGYYLTRVIRDESCIAREHHLSPTEGARWARRVIRQYRKAERILSGYGGLQ